VGDGIVQKGNASILELALKEIVGGIVAIVVACAWLSLDN